MGEIETLLFQPNFRQRNGAKKRGQVQLTDSTNIPLQPRRGRQSWPKITVVVRLSYSLGKAPRQRSLAVHRESPLVTVCPVLVSDSAAPLKTSDGRDAYPSRMEKPPIS